MQETAVEMCIKRLKNSSFIIAHYFIRIPSLDLEIHPGMYQKGNFLNLNSTKHYRVLTVTYACSECLNELLIKSENVLHAWYYPLINCETLTKGLCIGAPWSIQTILSTCAATVMGILFTKYEAFTATLLTLCVLVIMILCMQYNVRQDEVYKCIHV
ncbi:Orf33 [Heliothis zea nudivirus]|uniref:Orf33 n=1 Tax=Heliothis zea nudivirus 1 TaxID=3116536 RepID=Q8JKS8_9VIRU|nr:Orf33 [Heliothis zea nudivirus]AAN04328.1 Orf33 [Heliothis zea nudivirus]